MNTDRIVSLADMNRLISDLKNDLVAAFKLDIQKVQTQIEFLTLRCCGLEQKLETVLHLQQEQQKEIDELRFAVTSMESVRIDVCTEMEDRESRRNNIIVFGLPELSATISERFEFDEQQVDNILSELNIPDCEAIELRRLGKTNNGKSPRPLKVTLSSRIGVQRILNKTRLLKHSARFKEVFISKDRTKQQQNEWQEMRREFDRRKRNKEDVVIYNGKICLRSELRKNFQE